MIAVCFLPVWCSAQVYAPAGAVQKAATGVIAGSVADSNGSAVAGAQITLASEGFAEQRLLTSDSEGRFTFASVAPGKFTLTISANGMATVTTSGVLNAGEAYQAPTVVLRIATASTEVDVTVSQHEMAETEIKTEEHQRILGFAPNFYVSYTWKAAPLTAGQKFKLDGRTLVDPVNFALIGFFAGLEQAGNSFSGYGQGFQGYAKRYGAGYADFAIGTTLGGAILPVVFRQDPRYFYKGTGTKWSRAEYALSTAVIARGDNGKWQPAYANVLASFGAGAISNLYYPAANRNGASLTIKNGALSLAFDGVANVFQELAFRKVSSGARRSGSTP
jgi:hypothetical protein